jgi:hypothetical protein
MMLKKVKVERVRKGPVMVRSEDSLRFPDDSTDTTICISHSSTENSHQQPQEINIRRLITSLSLPVLFPRFFTPLPPQHHLSCHSFASNPLLGHTHAPLGLITNQQNTDYIRNYTTLQQPNQTKPTSSTSTSRV